MVDVYKKLEANRRYPSLPDTDGSPEATAELARMIKEALEIGERRTGNIDDSYVRVRDLKTLGLVNIDSITGTVLSADDDVVYCRRDKSQEITGVWTFTSTAVFNYLSVTDGITAPATVTGKALIYVDTSDGDLKVKFGDGTVKTIVTDT